MRDTYITVWNPKYHGVSVDIDNHDVAQVRFSDHLSLAFCLPSGEDSETELREILTKMRFLFNGIVEDIDMWLEDEYVP